MLFDMSNGIFNAFFPFDMVFEMSYGIFSPFFHLTLLLTYPMEFDVTYHQYPSTKSTKKGLEILNLRFLGLIHTYALTTTISPSLMCAFTCSRLSSSKIKSVS